MQNFENVHCMSGHLREKRQSVLHTEIANMLLSLHGGSVDVLSLSFLWAFDGKKVHISMLGVSTAITNETLHDKYYLIEKKNILFIVLFLLH